MIIQLAAAFLGTLAFSVIYSVPRRYSFYCGAVGAVGWLVYCLGMKLNLTASEATFFSTVTVMLISRYCAVFLRCPATVFIICGIFPLVPGIGIYWTTYYLVSGEMKLALENGLAALKTAFAIVLGIVLIYELPYRFFIVRRKKTKKS